MMQSELNPVDNLVEQIKGNSSFLRKILFSRRNIAVVAIISALFLIAALTVN